MAVAPAEPPAEEASPPSGQLHWNAWAEEPPFGPLSLFGRRYKPEQTLREGGKKYDVVIDLAPIAYRLGAAVATSEASETVTEVLARAAAMADEYELRLLILPDDEYFKLDGSRDIAFDINLKKLREKDSPAHPATLAEAADSEIGRAVFRVQTRDRIGRGNIAVSIWDQDKPVDELVLSFCVGPVSPQCTGTSSVSNGLAGVDSARLTPGGEFSPDAALHFIEMERGGARTLRGVLRRRSDPKGEYYVWDIDRSVEELRANTLTFADTWEVVSHYPDEDLFRTRGDDLFTMIFPQDSSGREASRRFVDFVRTSTAQRERDGYAPSLFIRMVALQRGAPFMLPFGLLAVPAAADPGAADNAVGARDDAARPPANVAPVALAAVDTDTETDAAGGPATAPGEGPTARTLTQIGFDIRIEMPLPWQSYAPSAECLSRWIVAMPDENADLDTALRAALNNRGAFRRWDLQRLAPAGKSFAKMTDLDAYLRAEQHLDATGIVITGHHSNNQIFFNQFRNDAMVPTAIKAQFEEPSLVILNGCNTAGATTTEFIQSFNQHRVRTIIATNTSVDGRVAGQFLDCFTLELLKAQDGRPVSEAFSGAIRCLRGRSDGNGKLIGSRALTYVLLGDGSLRICPPFREDVGDDTAIDDWSRLPH